MVEKITCVLAKTSTGTIAGHKLSPVGLPWLSLAPTYQCCSSHPQFFRSLPLPSKVERRSEERAHLQHQPTAQMMLGMFSPRGINTYQSIKVNQKSAVLHTWAISFLSKAEPWQDHIPEQHPAPCLVFFLLTEQRNWDRKGFSPVLNSKKKN